MIKLSFKKYVKTLLAMTMVFGSLIATSDTKKYKKPIFLPGASTLRNTRASDGNQFAPPSPNQSIKRESYYLNSFETFEQFDSFASFSEGVIKGSSVKFLIDNRTEKAEVNFINGNFVDTNGQRPEYVKYHYFFAMEKLGIRVDSDTFNNETYFTKPGEKKKFIAGTLQLYEYVNSEGEKKSILGVQFYPQDSISEGNLLFAIKQVKSALRFTQYPLAFVAYGSQQTVLTIGPQLAELLVLPMTVEQIYSGISYIPMQKGTTYGFLKLFPKGEALDDLGPMDIPVFDELPLDLSVVAGVITTVVQDAGAHVNLKSKERNTPNMVLKDKEQIKELALLNNKPIKLIVGDEKSEIIALEDSQHDLEAAKKIVQEFHANIMKNKKPVMITSGTATAVVLFDVMAKKLSPQKLVDSSKSYGGKASKLALLAHQLMVGTDGAIQKEYKYRMSPTGFSIPVTYYAQLKAANPELSKKLDDLQDAEMARNGKSLPTPRERLKMLTEVQDLFYKAVVPESLITVVKDQARELISFAQEVYPKSPISKVKVRSSSNAEDIPQFDGAGLHSSYSADITNLGFADQVCKIVKSIDDDGVSTKEDIEPSSLLCAIKGVYASLWNKRAIEERNFARIDQKSATMGIAINVAYNFRKKSEKIKEIGNAVVVTRIINAKGVYGYRMSVNDKDNLVTNPTPGTQSEIVLATFLTMKEKPELLFIQYAKTEANVPVRDKQFLPNDQFDFYTKIIDIARKVENSYCTQISSYYSGNCAWVVGDPDKPSSLDMEFKIYSNGEVLLKQVREFSGR